MSWHFISTFMKQVKEMSLGYIKVYRKFCHKLVKGPILSFGEQYGKKRRTGKGDTQTINMYKCQIRGKLHDY